MRDVKSFIVFACSAVLAAPPAANVPPLCGRHRRNIIPRSEFGNKFMRHWTDACFVPCVRYVLRPDMSTGAMSDLVTHTHTHTTHHMAAADGCASANLCLTDRPATEAERRPSCHASPRPARRQINDRKTPLCAVRLFMTLGADCRVARRRARKRPRAAVGVGVGL